jgi:hypothetical protein
MTPDEVVLAGVPSIQALLPYYIKVGRAFLGMVKALVTDNINAYITNSIAPMCTLWVAVRAIPAGVVVRHGCVEDDR